MKTFQIQTLGCKVNTYESEYYRQTLLNAGYLEDVSNETTDIVVINTCTVTNTASFKSRQKIAQAKKTNPHAFIVVIGCYVQTHHDYLKEKYDIDLLIGTKDKNYFLQMIESMQNHDEFELPKKFETLPILSFKHQKKAYIKIQDGCNQFCTYCIIPYARGRERSLSEEEIVNQIKHFDSHKEITLAGIHTGRYGKELNTSLYNLLINIIENTRIDRIRISSIEVTEISDEIIQLIKSEPRFARHLHVPIQAANDQVLKAMNRPYTVTEYIEKLNYIRHEIPDICISTDLIVGFPSETEEIFESSLTKLNECNFSFMHVFPFSKRELTEAATMQPQYSSEVKKDRVHKALKLSDLNNQLILKSWIGKKIDVLCEGYHDNYIFGYSSQYLPVLVIKTDDLINKIIRCKVIDVLDEYLIAEREENYEIESII
jgi:threonylcarbamoyladenosine tRNA methylthiotransferase MtaB